MRDRLRTQKDILSQGLLSGGSIKQGLSKIGVCEEWVTCKARTAFTATKDKGSDRFAGSQAPILFV